MTREEAKKELSKMIFELGFEDNVDDKVYALNMAIQALSQEPSRDIKEIAEVMRCNADAETKCKMISNILTAKPHYFKEQEPCDDAVSRDAVEQMIKAEMPERGAWEIGGNIGDIEKQTVCEVCVDLLQGLNELPSVTHKSGKWILKRTFPTKLYDEHLNEYQCSECYRGIRCTESQLVNYPYCHCGAKMESEDKE